MFHDSTCTKGDATNSHWAGFDARSSSGSSSGYESDKSDNSHQCEELVKAAVMLAGEGPHSF